VGNSFLYKAVEQRDRLISCQSQEKIITIPKGIVFDKILRLKGAGMPIYDSSDKFGDLFVKVKYKIPKEFSDEEALLLEKLRRLYNNRK
jgi:curved DNA-binding protein